MFIKADGSQGTGTASGGGNDFVVTLSYNDQTGMWEPDCTFHQWADAISAGKEVGIYAYDGINDSPLFAQFEPYLDQYDEVYEINYGVTVASTTTTSDGYDYFWYQYTDNDLQFAESWTFVDNSYADATTADVLAGKWFGTPTGVVEGTATARSSSDLTVSGATVTVPSGFYSSQASKAVASGAAGTPTASKGTVSNHRISVTPSVTNTTGYITGSTKTGTAVTVSASELVSGSETKTTNGTYDVTNLAELVVNVSGGSSKAIYTYTGLATRTANSYGSTSATVTVTKAGTYTISYVAIRGSSSGTMGTNLHIGSTSGTNNTTWNNGTYGQYVHLTNQSISANQAVTIYATSGSNSRTIYVGMLIVEEQ